MSYDNENNEWDLTTTEDAICVFLAIKSRLAPLLQIEKTAKKTLTAKWHILLHRV